MNARQRLTTLREERAATWGNMQQLSAAAIAEERDLTAAEYAKYNGLEADFRAKGAEIERLEREEGIETGRTIDRGTPLAGERGSAAGNGPVLGREQRMRDWAAKRSSGNGSFSPAEADEFCLGNVLRAMVQPAFRSELTDVERRALAEGVDAQGGFTTPEALSTNVIDKIRNVGQVFKAGATTVPLDSDKQSIPRLSGDPTGSWRAENAPFTESQHAFERVTFTPKSYGFIVKASEELFQDMVPGAGRVIENAIVQTAALELDRAVLRGDGTGNAPTGLRFQPGVTIQSLGANGATPENANLMAALSTLLGANREPNGIVYSPRTAQTFAGKMDSTGQPLRQPEPVAALAKFVTNQLPNNLTVGTSTDTSEIYLAQWGDVLVGIRLGVQLRLLGERYADAGQIAWRVFLRADVQLAHPESAVVITGVRP